MKAVIFDMDGVLVNSEPLHFEFERRIAESLGFSMSGEDLKPFVGISNFNFWTILKEQYGLKQDVEWLMENDRIKRLEFFMAWENIVLIPGVEDLLKSLRAAGCKIGLASSSPVKMIDVFLEKTNAGKYFDYILSGFDVEHGKPAPDIFLRTAENLGVKPEDCLVVEDSTNGVKAAAAAGMKCLGFRNPDSGNQDLTKATFILDSFEGIGFNYMKTLFEG